MGGSEGPPQRPAILPLRLVFARDLSEPTFGRILVGDRAVELGRTKPAVPLAAFLAQLVLCRAQLHARPQIRCGAGAGFGDLVYRVFSVNVWPKWAAPLEALRAQDLWPPWRLEHGMLKPKQGLVLPIDGVCRSADPWLGWRDDRRLEDAELWCVLKDLVESRGFSVADLDPRLREQYQPAGTTGLAERAEDALGSTTTAPNHATSTPPGDATPAHAEALLPSLQEGAGFSHPRPGTAPTPIRPRDGGSEYIRRQSRAFLNTSLLPWTRGGIGSFRLLWPELVVPAPIYELKAQLRTTIDQWMHRRRLENTVIVGGAGSGKSTIVKYIFLTLAQDFGESGGPLPVYVHASEITHRPDETQATLLDFCKDSPTIVTLVDGLDEVTVADARKIVTEWLPMAQERGRWVLASRDVHFYSHVHGLPGLDEAASALIEVQPWQLDDSRRFANSYFSRLGRPSSESEAFESAISQTELRDCASNPFQLTLLMFLFLQGVVKVTANGFELYSAFYRNWVSHEMRRSRRPGTNQQVQAIAAAHEKLAVSAHSSRHSTPFERVFEELDVSDAIKTDSAFTGLLAESMSPISLNISKSGFRHQSLLEFLVSRSVVTAIMGVSDEVPGVLGEEFSIEINMFIRSAFAALSPDDATRAAFRAQRLYEHLLQQQEVSGHVPNAADPQWSASRNAGPDAKALRAREQLVYFMGRMSGSRAADAVGAAYKHDPEPLIRRAAALGAILHGRRDIEEEYMLLIRSDAAEGRLNRSVQLVYFGDVTESIFSFRDDGTSTWTRTRSATFERLGTKDQRSSRLRWWDLITIHSFFSTRQHSPPLSCTEREILEGCLEDPSDGAQQLRGRSIRGLVGELLQIDDSGGDVCLRQKGSC